MWIELIGSIHLFFSTLGSFYGILFPKTWFDKVFMLYVLFLLFSWTMFNGECLVSYVFKKMDQSNYIAGEDSHDMKDMYIMFKSETTVRTIATINTLAHMLTEYIVFYRNQFPLFICYLVPAIHLFYNFCIYNLKDIYKNNTFLIIQDILRVIIILLILYYLRRLYK